VHQVKKSNVERRVRMLPEAGPATSGGAGMTHVGAPRPDYSYDERPGPAAWTTHTFRFWDVLELHGDRPALLDEDGRIISYAALARMADDSGFSGARRLVLLAIDNSIEATAAYIGALRAGHAVILTGAASGPAFQQLIDRYSPEIVWTRDRGLVVRAAQPEVGLHPDLALLLSTSGSTGSAKLVRLSADAVDANARAIRAYLGIDTRARAISTLPPSYSYGLSVLNSHLAAGAAVILSDRSVADPDFAELVERLGATSMAGVPYTYQLLITCGLIDRLPPSIRTLTQAGGQLAPDLVERVRVAAEAQGARLFVMYGQTEATARMAFVPPAMLRAHADCIGQPIPGGRFELVDPDTGAPAERAGELVYRGPNVMMGYAQAREDLERGRDIEALSTGDLAERVAPDLYRITGRKSRFIKIFGLRIALDEVEREAARRGWTVVATGDDSRLVVASERDRDAAEIARALAGHFNLPAGRVVGIHVQALPRLANGKIDYGALLAEAQAAEEPASNESDPLAAYAALLARIAHKQAVGDDASFESFGGDSLNYVEAAILLERAFGDLPAGWESMTLAELRAAVPAGQLTALPRAPASLDIDHVQTMRSIAIMLVVASHSWHALPVWTSTLPYHFFRHVNLMFIFVAGYLFQYLLKNFSFGSYFKVKLQTVLLPYCIVSIPLILIYVLGFKDPAPLHAPAWAEDSELMLTLHMLATGTHLAPLWFIPMIMLIYVIAPALRFVDQRPSLYWLVVPALLLSAVIGRPEDNENPVRAVGYYLPAYLIGMAACRYRAGLIPLLQKGWPLLLAAALIPLLFARMGPAHDYINMLSKIGLCLGGVGLLSLHSHRVPAWFNRIGDLSFGIYFVHGYLTALVAMIAMREQLPLQGATGFLILFTFAMAGSIALVLIVKAVLGPWSRRVIGA
jgi:acyl-coenzyme A synthetase/AMP-(fatty) acid ligase/peptidoglycan/LPS O-acetylase OafA/YrhL